MKVLLQRSLHSSVSIDGNIVGKIEKGLVIFVGFTKGDSVSDIDYLLNKVLHLRIFDDENGVMNRSLFDIEGEVLSISQFTLYADTEKGRRPSYAASLKGEEAEPLYHLWNQKIKETLGHIETGVFGSDMLVTIENDGPVTIMLESRGKND